MNEISEELRLLSELVATISRETPYRVADDYFQDLAERVTLRIKTQHKPLVFNVPEGYFEGFAESLLARIKAGAGVELPEFRERPALQPMSAVAGTPGQELKELSPLLAQLRAKETYRLPEGYFEELSPILTVAGNNNPYTVPERYFLELPAAIDERLLKPQVEKKPAKVVAFGGRRTSWWKYSAAAVVAGLILTVGWLRLHVNDGKHPGSPDFTAKLRKVSDQDLQNFLANQDPAPAQQVNNAAGLEFNDSDVRSLLGEIPDGELRQYLEEHGGANDIATN